jgi:Transposase DDE domain group 1
MDSTEVPVYGEQEWSAYNGHFESTCCCCSTATATAWQRNCAPGNVHSAEGLEELLLPEIKRQQQRGKEAVFRADAAFAKPELYAALESAEREGMPNAFLPTITWSGTLRSC